MVLFQGALNERASELVNAGRRLYARGWVPATSGNFSARLDTERFAMTASGADKGELSQEDILVIDTDGQAVDAQRAPSAETLLHTSLYRRFPGVGAVLHVHSMNVTMASLNYPRQVVISGLELLKVFPGIDTHKAEVTVPVFANDQSIPRLSRVVEAYLDANSPVYGYLIEGHGLYTWGRTVSHTLRYLEALDFLLECKQRLDGKLT